MDQARTLTRPTNSTRSPSSYLYSAPSLSRARLGKTSVSGRRMNLMRAAVRLVIEGNSGPEA